MSHKKFGPDRFSRFDVYWIQTDRQINRQTDRQAKFIYRLVNSCKCTVQQTEHTGRELSSPLGMIYGCPYSQLRMLFFKFKYLELRSIISLHFKGYLVQGITKGEPGLESFIYSFSLNLKYENK